MRWTTFPAAALSVFALLLGSASPAGAAGVMDNACPPDRVPPSPFYDTYGNTHEEAIDCVAWYGIASGVSENEYAGGRGVQRDQMASFMARSVYAMRGALPEPGRRFSDIDGNPHANAVERLAEARIVSGTGDGTYDPGKTVARGQMATFLVRTYEYLTGSTLVATRDYFSDDNGTTHEPNINKAAEAGFTSGQPDGRYAPAGAVRRDQMASFVARMIGLAVDRAPGGRLNPYAVGTPAVLFDQWEMQVVSSKPNANDEVAEENQFNEAPRAGHQFFMVRLRATYVGEGSSSFDGAYRIRALGPSGVTYSTFENSCGVIPDEISNSETFKGGTIEGNICFEVRSEDADGLSVFDSEQDQPSRPYFLANA